MSTRTCRNCGCKFSDKYAKVKTRQCMKKNGIIYSLLICPACKDTKIVVNTYIR